MHALIGATPKFRPAHTLALLLLALAAALAPGAAYAAGNIGDVAQALKKSPVYVDPRAQDQLSKNDADALARKIEDADKPVFVAVLPEAAEYPPDTVLRDLRTLTGVTGVYAIRLGDRFAADADRQVMPGAAVDNAKGAVRRSYASDAPAQLNAFVDQALQQAKGNAPSSWADDEEGAGATGLLVAGGAVIVGGTGAYALYRRSKKKRDERERAELDALRAVVDEDITAFGEELDRLDFATSEPGATDAMCDDFTSALDAYDRAKVQMAEAARPGDVQPVTETLGQGRFALATLAARRAGAPLPERRMPCFFDPRHGPSISDVNWCPPGGVLREVPACAEDAVRVSEGGQPLTRMVPTASGPQPYWNGGSVYAPWAGGYFGGTAAVAGGLLAGTMLGSMISAPSAFADAGALGSAAQGLPDGGEVSGADFNPADFASGFGGGDIGGGGGDFGGGDW